MINKEELFSIYKQIKTEPQTWNQNVWAIDWDLGRERGQSIMGNVCGTAYCFAGHAVVRAGYRIVWPNHSIQSELAEDDKGNVHEIETLAQNILGLDEDQAEELFGASNELEHIRVAIKEFTGEDPEQ